MTLSLAVVYRDRQKPPPHAAARPSGARAQAVEWGRFMQSRFALLLAAAVVVGGATAAFTTLLLVDSMRGTREAAPAGRTAPGTPTLEARMSERLAALQRQLRELRQRLDMLESRPAPAPRRPVGELVSPTDLESFKEEVRQSLATSKTGSAPPQLLKTQVAEALASIRKDEAVERVTKGAAKRREQLERRLDGMTQWLGLDARQIDQMRAVLTASDERDQDVIRMWRAGVDDEVLGQAKESNRQEFVDSVATVLTPAQLQAFQADEDGEGKDRRPR
ncbi:MAG: hypothetical protein AAF628_33030 [Planctomycetota bacterium]